MTPRDIEQAAVEMEAAAVLLRQVPQLAALDDGQPAARAMVQSLTRICRARAGLEATAAVYRRNARKSAALQALQIALDQISRLEEWLRSEVHDVLDQMTVADDAVAANPPRTAAAVAEIEQGMRDACRSRRRGKQ